MATKKEETSKQEKATTEVKDTQSRKLSADNIERMAKQIWLAGLGAYGRSFDEVQTRFEKMNTDSQNLFEELVSRGEKLQSDTENKLKEGKDDVESRIEKLKKFVKRSGDSEVTDQISDVNRQLSEQLNDVSRKLDTLNKEVKKRA